MNTTSITQTHPSVLTLQKAEQIQMACIQFCKLFDTPEQNADPDAIYTLPSNQNAIEEAKINELSDGLVRFRLVKKDYLFFKFHDYGKTFFLTGARAYNNICKHLLSTQSEIEQMKSHHNDFINNIQTCQLIPSKEEMLQTEEAQMMQICEDFYDKFFSNIEQLYYLPSLKSFNQIINSIFGGVEFYPVVCVDDSSRIVLQIHTEHDDDKNLCSLTCKRIAVQNKDKVVSHILKCWRQFYKIEMRTNRKHILINNSIMNKKSSTKIVEQGTATQSFDENGKSNYKVAKKVAIYLVQDNNNGSALADFALFSGVTSASLVENATNGAVTARVTQEAIVLEERASGYELAFMTKFISDPRHEERLVEDIALFISKAMGEVKQETSIEDVPETDNTDIVVNTEDEIDTTIINEYNSTFAESESEILNYMRDAADIKTRKLRLYSKTCECLFGAGYKGNKHKDKVMSLLTPENRRRYDELLSLTA